MTRDRSAVPLAVVLGLITAGDRRVRRAAQAQQAAGDAGFTRERRGVS